MSIPRDSRCDLLPWYVAGSLSPEDASACEEHLADCPECKKDLPWLRALHRAARHHGAAFFADHPGPDLIVAAAHGDLPRLQRSAVEQHIAFCRQCSSEIALLENAPPDAAPSTPSRTGPLPETRAASLLPWVAVAALMITVALVLYQRLGPPRGTGLVEVRVIPSVQRSSNPEPVVIPASARDFVLVFPLEHLQGDDRPVELIIRSHAGPMVYRAPEVQAMNSYVFIYCRRRDFPEGDYEAILATSGQTSSEDRIQFRFHVLYGTKEDR